MNSTDSASPAAAMQESSGPLRIVLGSSSPRRLALLELMLPEHEIRAVPPADDREADLTGLRDRTTIAAGLKEIALAKSDQVASQLQRSEYDFLLTADTCVVVPEGSDVCVLGKPDPHRYPAEVRDWFERYYLGRVHEAWTAFCWRRPSGEIRTGLVTTQIEFLEAPRPRVDWYLATGESLGKAGGYAIQGLGSCFIRQVTGSLSNVVGLPLLETLETLEQFCTQSEQL